MVLKTNELKRIIFLLEKLSLVNFANVEGIRRLNEAVKFADQLKEVNTEGVKPMVSVLENECPYLREDIAIECNRKSIQQNAVKLVEDYFVAPPGNVPLKTSTGYFDEKVAQKTVT